MRKIINGRKYDTETASMVAEHESGYPSDFSYVRETLYRKRGGEYFIHGVGNAASKYAEPTGLNSWRAGERVMPLTWDEAREWAETNMGANAYEAEFGEVSEGEGDAMLSVRVSAAAKAALDRYCARTGRAKGEVVEGLLATLA